MTGAALMAMVSGLYRTQMLYVMARLGIADHVAAGPRSAAELAAETGADPDALFRVLRALASLGVLTQDEDDRFGPTEASELLRPGTSGSPHARLLCYGEPWWWSVTGGLLETVMTGEPGFERVHGSGLFEWLAEHPDASATFDAHMTAMTGAEVDAVVPRRRCRIPARSSTSPAGAARSWLRSCAPARGFAACCSISRT